MNKLTDLIKSFSVGSYINKTKKTELDTFCKELGDIKYAKLKESLKEVINATKFTKKLGDQLETLMGNLQIDDITQSEKCDLIEELIKEINEDNLEKELDEDCDRYMKYTKSNPAPNVKYNKAKCNYVLSLNGKEKTSKKIDTLVTKAKENFRHEKKENFQEIVSTKQIQYKGKKIIIYMIDRKAYFDINHVINLFDKEKSKKDKYQEYKSSIVLYDIRDNQHGGFYVKEFIDKETFFKMLLHTNSVFSNKFKDDVAKILDKLSDDGKIIIVDNKLIVKTNNDILTDEYVYTQTYDNDVLIDFIKSEIIKCKKLNWHKYCDMHIMYSLFQIKLVQFYLKKQWSLFQIKSDPN